MGIVEDMKCFMEPKSVALIGVSRNVDGDSFNPLKNLINYGFEGKIYPINPKADEILGIKTYPHIRKVPGDVDLGVVITPRSAVPARVKECTEKGVRAVIIIAQGFADSDSEGRMLQEETVRIARRGKTRIIGPNTFGVINAYNGFSTALPHFELETTPVGVISQSGIFFVGLSDIIFGKAIDVGDCCDIDFADSLAYFEDDHDIRVVLLHMEGISDGQKFFKAAKRTSTKKPLVVLKSGRSERGGKAAQSHTGSIVGKDEVYDAVFKAAGVIRADDEEEAENLVKSFLTLPLMKGKRISIMTWAGSTGVITVDACEKYGMDVTDLSEATLEMIRKLSPPQWLPLGNPVDIWACMGLKGFNLERFRDEFKIILDALLYDRNSDGVVVIIPDFLALFSSLWWDVSVSVKEAAEEFPSKPIVFSIFGPKGDLAKKLTETGKTLVFNNCERAVRVLAKSNEYYEFVQRNQE
ncbi:MAG: succinyl-CoA synthetase subunit alpha [Candidatus Methanolliviera sp. GoM_oil]|nr:MAG: succinyl-CoA synthetase subunit alpha [Candidatus Methanolliviera sp. GoM_oil]